MTGANHRIWVVLLPAMLLPLVGSLFYFVILGDHPFAKAFYTFTKLFTLVWPLVAIKWVLREPLPQVAWGHFKDWKFILMGLLAGVLISGVILGLLFTPLLEIVKASAGNIRQKTQDLGVLNHYWAFAVFLALAHSLLEEYYWRWFVYGQLRRVVSSRWMPHLLAAASFAVHHIVIATQFFPLAWGFALGACVGIGGFIWSLLYQHQKSLIGPWVSHIVVDFTLLGIGHWLVFSVALKA